MTLFATAAFGLEGVVASELKRLGMRDVRAEVGGRPLSWFHGGRVFLQPASALRGQGADGAGGEGLPQL